MDPLETETSEFWKNFGPLNDVDPAKIQTEVFRFPTSCFAEETGSFTNSSRVISGRRRRSTRRAKPRPDSEIMARLFIKLRGMYAKDGGTLARAGGGADLAYLNANVPSRPSCCARSTARRWPT
jgi:anaerobic selenocysteine-containing dehydrogenase